jgi:hypothetical protein
MRNTGLQIKIKSTLMASSLLDVARQYSLHPIKGLEAGSDIYLHHADLATNKR